MSLDIWLEDGTGKEMFESNITNNLVGMWKEAGVYGALYQSNGKRAKEVLPELENGLRLMTEEPGRFFIHNSKNGWGTHKQAVPWLEGVIKEFKKNPDSVIGTSV